MKTVNKRLARTSLFITQFLSANILILWAYVYITFYPLFREQGVTAFTMFPLVPVSFSIYAWIEFRRTRYHQAVLFSTIPVLISVLILMYYFAIGVTSAI